MAWMPQVSVLVQVLYSLYMKYILAEPETNLVLFTDDACIYDTDMNVVFSATCNTASLQASHGVSAETQGQ
jgi:hypothetical protein